MRILLVEDDEMIGELILKRLMERGYTVDWLKDGESAEAALISEDFSAVLLDIGLPKQNGFEVLENIRAKGVQVPVVIISARNSVQDITKGLDLGADDYLQKPFSLEILMARLRALQRRVRGRATPLLEYGPLRLDPASHSVYANNARITLSPREYALLHKLLEHMGEVVSRESLLQCIYGWETEIESNAVEVHVHNLRKKLPIPCVKTVRGVGYIVDLPQSTPSASAEMTTTINLTESLETAAMT